MVLGYSGFLRLHIGSASWQVSSEPAGKHPPLGPSHVASLVWYCFSGAVMKNAPDSRGMEDRHAMSW